MNELIVYDAITKNGNKVTYKLDEIKFIRHGLKEFDSYIDTTGDEYKPLNSYIQILFKDGTTATFGSNWVLLFQ